MPLIRISSVPQTYLHVSLVSTAVLRSAATLPRRPITNQQVRAFRIGLLSSHLDPDFEKEYRRRHRIMKHKYIEALNRKLTWERHFPAHLKTYGFKSFICSAWHGQDSRLGARWVDAEEMLKENKKMVERLYRWSRARSFGATMSPLTDSKSEPSSLKNSSSAPSAMYGSEGFRRRFQNETSTSNSEYEIDPITNRKVYKNISGQAGETTHQPIEIPVKTFEGCRYQFQRFSPPEPPPEEKPSHPSLSTPVREALDPVQEGLKEYDSKVDYENGGFYDVSSSTINYDECGHGLKDHDDKLSRKVQRCGFNDSKLSHKSSADDILKTAGHYRDPVQTSMHHYEATVKRPQNLLRAIQEYQSKRSKARNSSEEQEGETHPLIQALQEFELSRSQAAGDAKLDPLLKAIQEFESNVAADRNITGKRDEKVEGNVDVVLKSIEDYRASLLQGRNIHDESRPYTSVEDSLKDYDSKVDYSRGRHSKIFSRGDEDTTEDIDLLRASDVRAASGITKNQAKESEREKLAKRKELEQSFEISQSPQLASEEERSVMEDMRKLRRRNSAKYLGMRIENNELQNLVAHVRGRVNTKIAGVDARLSSNLVPREMTRNFVRDFPEELESSWHEHESGGTLMPKSRSAQEITSAVQRDEKAYSEGLEISKNSANGSRIETSLDRSVQRGVQDLNTSHEVQVSPSLALQGEGDLSVSVPSFNNPKDDIACARQAEGESNTELIRTIRDIYEKTYGIIDNKHRQVPGSSEVIEESTSSVPNSDEAPVFEQTDPTAYKILAYDPTMQSVSITETTSIVPDSSNALTPADALLRLSNPAKFFPHFQPLQSKGYEIVSGSGDVLVFRKVRSAAPASTSSANSAQNTRKDVRNPIDGMQGSPVAATGNFASPTGFVNHDLPRGSSDPPFKSNIDVRREEAVFSGKKNWQVGKSESCRRKGRGKKVLVSAVWVAGCCYAIGVVADFFQTGGIDGMGPQGF